MLHLVERPPATTDSPSSSTNTASQSESTTSTANTAGSNFNPGHLVSLLTAMLKKYVCLVRFFVTLPLNASLIYVSSAGITVNRYYVILRLLSLM